MTRNGKFVIRALKKLARLVQAIADRERTGRGFLSCFIHGNDGCDQTVSAVDELRHALAAPQDFGKLLLGLPYLPAIFVHVIVRNVSKTIGDSITAV